MAELIFSLTRAKSAQTSVFTTDDLVSRQSITIREAVSLGIPGDAVFVRISGSPEALERAQQIAQQAGLGVAISAADAARVAKAIDEQEEAAASGMGLFEF